MPEISFGGDLNLPDKGRIKTGGAEAIRESSGDEIQLHRTPRVLRWDFTKLPDPIAAAPLGAGAATGTAGDVNLLMWPLTGTLEYIIKGTQTILGPAMVAGGLDIGSLDQTANDGIELVTSGNAGTFTVGTDAAFYMEVELTIADVSGTDDCFVGFRKVEDGEANLDDYDELAGLNVISGAINIETILNGDDTTTTDTTDTWADGEKKKLRIEVSAAGVVTYKIDDAPPTTTAAFTFDNGEVVRPCIFFLQDTDIAGSCPIGYLEVGHL